MPKLPVTLPAPTSVQTSGRIRTPIGSVLTRSAQPLEQTLDRAQNQIQQNTARATAPSRAGILGGANLVTGITFVNGVNQAVNTGLRTPLQGFIISNARNGTAGRGGTSQRLAADASARHRAAQSGR